MLIVVITDDVFKKELLALPHAEELRLHYIGHPDEYPRDISADACIDLLFDGSEERVNRLKNIACKLTIINAVISTLHGTGAIFTRINGWPGFLRREIIEAASADDSLRDNAAHLFALLGKKTEWVPDICGFISARIIAAIINEAFFALEENISSEQEIDTAMKLGTNYPFGPFEWAKMIGLPNVYALLSALAKEDTRYIPCKLLEKKALA